MLPKGITRGDIQEAIKAYDEGTRHHFGSSVKFDLYYEGRTYPPKAIIGLAARRVMGRVLGPEEFAGGEGTECFRLLRRLKFEIRRKGVPMRLEHHPYEINCDYKRKKDIHDLYGGQEQGGISTPSGGAYIFLFTGSAGTTYGYQDRWNSGVFYYTGEGQEGDMAFTGGNKAIRDHVKNGKDLLLFETLGKGKGVRFKGEFSCPTWEEMLGKDKNGDTRKIIVFHLIPSNQDSDPKEQSQLPQLNEVNLALLRKRAYEAATEAGSAPGNSSLRVYYRRSAAVKDYVLIRSKGFCESCKLSAPFKRLDGSPYLEPHHTRRVSDSGPDHPGWVAAICPNCHRQIHYGENGADINSALETYLGILEPDRPSGTSES